MRTQTDRTRVKAIMVTAAMCASPHTIAHIYIYARINKEEPTVETVMSYDLRSRALVGSFVYIRDRTARRRACVCVPASSNRRCSELSS